jgi:hypothetical protein
LVKDCPQTLRRGAAASARTGLAKGSHYFRGVEGMKMTSPDDQLEIHFQEAHGAR